MTNCQFRVTQPDRTAGTRTRLQKNISETNSPISIQQEKRKKRQIRGQRRRRKVSWRESPLLLDFFFIFFFHSSFFPQRFERHVHMYVHDSCIPPSLFWPMLISRAVKLPLEHIHYGRKVHSSSPSLAC